MVASANRAHVVTGPRNFIIIRIVQIVFALIALILGAYCAWFWSNFSTSGPGLTIFTALTTIIACIYIMVSHYSAPQIFNYWAVLGLDIFHLIFWLISFAVCASFVGSINGNRCVDINGYVACGDGNQNGVNAEAGAAGVGAILFILFGISTTIFAISLFRFRKNGGHSTPSRMNGASAAAFEPNSNMENKFEMNSTVQPVNQQQGYAAQGGNAPAYTNNQQYQSPAQQQVPQQYQQQQQQSYGQQQQPYAQQSVSGYTNNTDPSYNNTPNTQFSQPAQYHSGNMEPAQLEAGRAGVQHHGTGVSSTGY